MGELERTWWDQWIKQALPSLVPYKRWKHEHRSPQVKDIVLVHYDKRVGKGEYRLGRITAVRRDSHGIVRTVTVSMRGKDKDKPLPYISRPLDTLDVGVQRIAVICPVEDQDLVAEDQDSEQTQDLDAEEGITDMNHEDLDAEEQVLDMDSEDLAAEERTI